MKKSLIITGIILYPFLISGAQEKPEPVISKIKEVTVFVNGAQITRIGSVILKEGNQQLVFENLPQAMNAQSIQLSGTGNFTILAVNNQINYLKPQQKSKDIIALEDSVEILQYKLRTNNASLEVLKDEESLLKVNQSLGGSQTGVKVDELKAALELFRSRLTDIKTKTIKLVNDSKKLNELLKNLNDQLTQIRNKSNTPTSEVVVTLLAPSPAKAQLSLSYLVSEAGWMAAYDVRAIDIMKPINLIYKAKVFQSTGENWNDIKITLSTGNPAASGNAPIVNPWYLNIIEPVSRLKNELMEAKNVMLEEVAVIGYGAQKKVQTTASFTQTTINQTTVEFKIELPYNIPSNGQQYTVEVKSFTLPASYEYYCAPKLDTDAFLLAKITGWEELNMLSGESSLFFEGTFVGTAFIDTQNTKDTLMVSLGRDKGIVVTRIKQKDFTSKKFIGSTRKDSRSFEIVARNKKKQTINLLINDQVPLSTTKEIEVESTNISGGILEKASGKLTWKIQLQPSESRTFTNGYNVTYPKDKTIILE